MKNSQRSTATKSHNKRLSVEQSPFFHPSDPRLPKQHIHTTPRGTTTVVHTQKQPILDDEHKTGVFGTVCNLVVGIIGAGIVGIPYAIKKSGLVAGLAMTILSAVACDKSLRLLVMKLCLKQLLEIKDLRPCVVSCSITTMVRWYRIFLLSKKCCQCFLELIQVTNL